MIYIAGGLWPMFLNRVHSKNSEGGPAFPWKLGACFMLPPHAFVAWCTSCGVINRHGIQGHVAPAVLGTAGTEGFLCLQKFKCLIIMIYFEVHDRINH